MLHALMVGAAESYLGAIAVELGHDSASIALLATVPYLCGASAQLLSAPLARALGSEKRVVSIFAFLQAVVLLALAAIVYRDVRSLAPLLLAKCAFWTCGLVVAPPWNTWMASLTRGAQRRRYFAVRGALVQLALLFAFLGAGLVLHRAGASGARREAFTGVLIGGALARFVSALLLELQPGPLGERARRTTARARLRAALTEPSWRLPIFLASTMCGAYVAVPFFTPYMLRELELSYASFAGLCAIPLLTKAVAFRAAHRVAARLGLHRLLLLGGLGVASLPAVWAAEPGLAVLAVSQLLSGAAWTAFEYSSAQLLLGAAARPHRVEFFSLSSALTGVAQVVGAVTGGALVGRLGLGYREIFLVSAVARGLPLLLLLGPRPIGVARRLPELLVGRLIALRPTIGALQAPALLDEPRGPSEPER